MPGDFIFGRKKASKELKISEQSIRTFVEFLKTSQNITIKTTNKYSIISIVNWDTYQNEETSTNQQINQQLTNNQPTTNHKQERKKEKKEKNKYMDCVFLSADEEQSLRTKLLNGDFEKAIEVLNNYKMQSGKKYASDYHAMQNWVIKRIQEDGNKVSQALLSGFDDL